jgi:hypothetical protein
MTREYNNQRRDGKARTVGIWLTNDTAERLDEIDKILELGGSRSRSIAKASELAAAFIRIMSQSIPAETLREAFNGDK